MIVAAIAVVLACLAWVMGSLLGRIPRIYSHRTTYVVGTLLAVVCTGGFVATLMDDRQWLYPAMLHLPFWAMGGTAMVAAMREGHRRVARHG